MDFINRFFIAITQIHPTHPMFVHFPIALTGAAFFFILLAWWRNSISLEQTAFANMVLAAISTVVAGATGIIDNINNYEGAAPNAGLKITLATILFLLTTGISLVRYRNPYIFIKGNRLIYAGAYGLSFTIAFTLAFLGGIILYGF